MVCRTESDLDKFNPQPVITDAKQRQCFRKHSTHEHSARLL